METEQITASVREAFAVLLEAAKPKKGELLVLGCSTSEIMGHQIGSHSSEEAARAVLDALVPLCREHGLRLAVQGCEYINRALCTDRETMEHFGLQPVWVEPWLHAGGACVTEARSRIFDAVMVEDVQGKATLGIDIGDTLIGMHLKEVAVPVRLTVRSIGQAHLVCARTRPKYIGGERARYLEELK